MALQWKDTDRRDPLEEKSEPLWMLVLSGLGLIIFFLVLTFFAAAFHN